MIYKIIFVIIITGFCPLAKAQGNNNAANMLASVIANKMRDSLSLSVSQRNAIMDINLQLHSSKMLVRSQYNGTDSIGLKIQQIENNRDSLYKDILTPQQFDIYRQKKRDLISAN